MKRLFLLLTILFLLTGCKEKKEDFYKEIQVDDSKKADTYVDDNPIKVGIYQDNHIIKSYTTKLEYMKEITVFNVYYTNKETLDSSNIKYNFTKYYQEYKNIDKYKTGFFIRYEVEGKTIEKLILDASSIHEMSPYIYVYLYDDVNQAPGTFYSHLEPKDMKDSTIISSIKLFSAHKGTLISSPITLTAFTYDSMDDFTEDGHYRGRSSYTIEIKH